ncbi:MAG TPA: ATP synthase subunit C [Chlamydiales bacterium]|nr:ATP synthase subunit C [Chlamydiales bacterium]
MDLGMIGPGIVLGLGCLGSSIGCGIAGMASHGVMTRVDEGHAKFIGISAIPSSQSIYGFVLMVLMKNSILAGTLNPVAAIGIGFFVGIAIMASSIFQGKCAATAIQATAKQPSLFGKTFAALAIVESFALFAFVFAILII